MVGRRGYWQMLTSMDRPEGPTYYRLELHSLVMYSNGTGGAGRDHTAHQALSNPIWIRKQS